MVELFNTENRINIFCVNTPFQLFVLNKIISQHLHNEVNLIISTIPDSNSYGKVIEIHNSISGLISLRKLLLLIKKNIKKCVFYIPHLGSLLGSIFYDLSVKFDRPINIFYEGVALYYDPIIKQSLFVKIKRSFQGLLAGVPYHYHEHLYPTDFVKKVKVCYAPNRILLEKYKKVCLFYFKQEDTICKPAILLLLSNNLSNIIETNLLETIRNVVRNENIERLYIKPHYELKKSVTNHIISLLINLGIKDIKILDKRLPVESLYTKISFSIVVSQVFSSALINMKLIFVKQPRIYIIEKDIETAEIANKFCLEYE